MKRLYEVIVEATITKTYEIEAEDADKAGDLARERFTVTFEHGVPEDYKEEVLHVEEVRQ